MRLVRLRSSKLSKVRRSSVKITTLSEFRKSLLETGSYESSSETLAPVPRAQGRWTTFSFSWSVFFVFPFCAVREFFRSLTTELWAQCCFKTVQKSEKFGIRVTADGWVLHISLLTLFYYTIKIY